MYLHVLFDKPMETEFSWLTAVRCIKASYTENKHINETKEYKIKPKLKSKTAKGSWAISEHSFLTPSAPPPPKKTQKVSEIQHYCIITGNIKIKT